MPDKVDDDIHKNLGNWEPDPYHRHEQRWWTGKRWSEKVRSDNSTRIDPPGVIPKPISRHPLEGPASPISDARHPIRNVTPYVPHLLLIGFFLLSGICILAFIALAS